MPIHCPVPLVGFCAFSGTGKTTLVKAVVPHLKEMGLRVGFVKHAHHEFDIDVPGKDSYEIRSSGAEQVLVASRARMALIKEYDDERDEPSLAEALECIDERSLDLVLVEGFKFEHFPKIELYRPSLNKPRLYHRDPSVIAVASDEPLDDIPGHLPRLDLNDPLAIAQFVHEYAFSQQKETFHVQCHPNPSQLC